MCNNVQITSECPFWVPYCIWRFTAIDGLITLSYSDRRTDVDTMTVLSSRRKRADGEQKLLTSSVIFERCSITQNKRLLYIVMYNMEVRIVLKAGITNVASSIGTPLRRGALDTTLCDKVCQWLATGWWFFPGTLRCSTNKTDRHDISEILLKVELNTINCIEGRYWRKQEGQGNISLYVTLQSIY